MAKSAFLFPGQGTQYIGMGKTLYEQFPVARRTFEEANDITGFDLAALCFEGSLMKLSQSNIAQLAIVTVSTAAYRVLREELNLKPDYVAGHSLGEYSALVASGVLRFEDALSLLDRRGNYSLPYCDSGKGAMSIIDGVSGKTVDALCSSAASAERMVSIACYNAPQQTVISGHDDAVMEVEDEVVEQGGQITPLLMSGPFHSPLMQPVADLLRNDVNNLQVSDFDIPVISNVTGLPYTSPEDIKDLLLQHLTHPVRWMEILNYLEQQGVDTIIEVGPQHILSNLLDLNASPFQSYSFGLANELAALSSVCASPGAIPDAEFTAHCLSIAVSTRNRNDDEAAFNAAIDAYKQLESIDRELHAHKLPLSRAQKGEALHLLSAILEIKKVPTHEREKVLGQLVANQAI